MPELESIECDACGASFTAFPDSSAAENSYCSPNCETEGRKLRA